ncbi:hypothetical protein [Halomonas faecis]|uniref:hypothetical protein n=1 Tax=Halomonas faecis TaxID=1562110 RepID=UPI0013CF55C9|nr:hypothetical protein [Halomonas faecis]
MPASNALLSPAHQADDQPRTTLRALLEELSRRGIGSVEGDSIAGITVGSPEADHRPTTFSELLALLERQAQATLTFQVDADTLAWLTVIPGQRQPVAEMKASRSSALVAIADAWETCCWPDA